MNNNNPHLDTYTARLRTGPEKTGGAGFLRPYRLEHCAERDEVYNKGVGFFLHTNRTHVNVGVHFFEYVRYK